MLIYKIIVGKPLKLSPIVRSLKKSREKSTFKG